MTTAPARSNLAVLKQIVNQIQRPIVNFLRKGGGGGPHSPHFRSVPPPGRQALRVVHPHQPDTSKRYPLKRSSGAPRYLRHVRTGPVSPEEGCGQNASLPRCRPSFPTSFPISSAFSASPREDFSSRPVRLSVRLAPQFHTDFHGGALHALGALRPVGFVGIPWGGTGPITCHGSAEPGLAAGFGALMEQAHRTAPFPGAPALDELN